MVDSEKKILAAERAKKVVEQEAKDAAEKKKKKLKPATVPVSVEYSTPEGESKSVTLTIRVLNFDERNYAKILAATLANGKFNILPDDHAQYLVALATIFTMWQSNEIPKDLQDLLHEDEDTALQLYSLIEGHRMSRFQANGGQGARSSATVRLADLPEDAS
jgi:hypothetical protein